MSIAIGILTGTKPFDQAIAIAADSQTTSGNVKTFSANKITCLKFNGGVTNAIVAQAGNADRANRALEMLSEISQDKAITSKRCVAEWVEEALLRLKREMRHQQCDCTMEELRDYILEQEQNFQILIAYFYNHQPLFFVSDFWTGASNLQHTNYAAIGTGAELAGYLIEEHHQQELTNLASVISTAVWVVNEVKKRNQYCAGDTKLGVLLFDNQYFNFQPDSVAHMESIVSKFNAHTRQMRQKIITEVFDKSGQEGESSNLIPPTKNPP